MKHSSRAQKRMILRSAAVFLLLLTLMLLTGFYCLFPFQARRASADSYALADLELLSSTHSPGNGLIQLSANDEVTFFCRLDFFPLLGWQDRAHAWPVPHTENAVLSHGLDISTDAGGTTRIAVFGRVNTPEVTSLHLTWDGHAAPEQGGDTITYFETTLTTDDLFYRDGTWYYLWFFTLDPSALPDSFETHRLRQTYTVTVWSKGKILDRCESGPRSLYIGNFSSDP